MGVMKWWTPAECCSGILHMLLCTGQTVSPARSPDQHALLNVKLMKADPPHLRQLLMLITWYGGHLPPAAVAPYLQPGAISH